jgi:hypothetical protein
VALPIRLVELSGGFEYLDDTIFVAPTRLVMAVISAERWGCACNVGGCLKQRRLVAFDLDDQTDFGFLCNLEGFFWQ